MINIHLLNDEYTPIHLHNNQDIRLNEVKSTWKINEIPRLTLKFAEGSDASDYMEPRRTKLKMFDAVTNELIFKGRVASYNYNGSNSYSVDSIECCLQDSIQTKVESFKDKPSVLLKQIIDRHNTQVPDDMKFEVGECGIDIYRYYPYDGEVIPGEGGDTVTTRELAVGDTITVKANAKYIYAYVGGPRLNMNSGLKGRKADITQMVESGGRKWYWLYVGNWGGAQGWVWADEILEAEIVVSGTKQTSSPVARMSTFSSPEPVYSDNSKVKISPNATVYYVDSITTVGKPVASEYRNFTLTIGKYVAATNRYALYDGKIPIAWVKHEDIVLVSAKVPVQQPTTSRPYVERERIIECSLSESDTTWDVLSRELLPYGELVVDEFEGQNRISIVEDRGEYVDTPVGFGINILEFSESFNPTDIYTTLKPIGKPVLVKDSNETLPDITLPEEFISNPRLLELFDPRTRVKEFTDVESETDLREKANKDLEEQIWDKIECNITAINLDRLGLDYDSLNLGDKAYVETGSKFMANGVLKITQMDIDHLEGWKSSLIFGRQEDRLSDFFK